MKKTNKTRLLALALAALMVFMLAACSASSSSTTTTTVTTSKTDANGNTTTNTTTTEVGASVGTDGVTTTNETTTETTTTAADEDEDPEAEAAELTERLYAYFNGGSKGANEDGDIFYFAYNDENDNLMLAIQTVNGEFTKYQGYADELDGQAILTGYNEGNYIPYDLVQDEDGTFTLSFPENGDVAYMEIMEFDEFVSEFVDAWVNF